MEIQYILLVCGGGVVWIFPVNIIIIFPFICVANVSGSIFTLRSGIPLGECTTCYLSIYLLIDILVVSSFVVFGYYKLSIYLCVEKGYLSPWVCTCGYKGWIILLVHVYPSFLELMYHFTLLSAMCERKF